MASPAKVALDQDADGPGRPAHGVALVAAVLAQPPLPADLAPSIPVNQPTGEQGLIGLDGQPEVRYDGTTPGHAPGPSPWVVGRPDLCTQGPSMFVNKNTAAAV